MPERLEELKTRARKLLFEFKGADYVHGMGCLEKTGAITALLGKRVLLISSLHKRDAESYEKIIISLKKSGLQITGEVPSARPNSPKEDILSIKEAIGEANPEFVLAASGGSGIDAAKAAVVLADLGGDIEDYFGVGQVTKNLIERKKKLRPFAAVQTASGSAAHLTKYSNITDTKTLQKKIIVDEAVIPPKCLFDYSLTKSMPPDFTCDGAFDGLAHCLEAYFGSNPESFQKIEEIALTGIELIISSLEKAVEDPLDREARDSLGLATDLGGYAIMTGSTNGAHLTSFSLVDILSHGRACALLSPYYTVFFAPAIQRQLLHLARVFSRHGLMKKEESRLSGKELGLAVAQGLMKLERRVGFPTKLDEVDGMTDSHIEKALQAAKNPQLEIKLRSMPVPLTTELVDDYMGPVLRAAVHGDFGLIKTLER